MSKRTILCLVDSYPSDKNPAVGSFYQTQLGILKDQFQVEVFVLHGKEVNIKSWYQRKIQFIRSDYDKTHNFRVHHFLINNPFHNKWLRNFSKLSRFILLKHIEKISENLFKYCTETLQLIPDIIFAQTAQFMLPVAVPLKKKFKIPLVATEHYPVFAQMTDLWRTDDEFRNIVLAYSNEVNCFMVVSNYLACCLTNFGFRNKFEVIGNLISPHSIDNRDQSDMFKVLYIGYDNHLKDPHTFFKAVKIIKEVDKSIRFIVVNGINDFENIVKQYEVQDIVDVKYRLPHEEVIKIMQNEASVFVSTSTAETFGLSTAEAIVCGLPVISTNSGGNMDFVNNKNCILVDRKSPDKIAEMILQIKRDKHVIDKFDNRATILGLYGEEAFSKKLLFHFRSLLNTSHKK